MATEVAERGAGAERRALRTGSPTGLAMALGLFAVVLTGLGCAPKQWVPLDLDPHPMAVYLNGEVLDSTPAELKLRSDRDHKLFFKRDGYRPEMVVLRQVGTEEEPRLEPAEVVVRLAPLAAKSEKGLSIELAD